MFVSNYEIIFRNLTSAILRKRAGRPLSAMALLCLLLTATTANAAVQFVFGSVQGPTLLPGSGPDLSEDAEYIYQDVAISTDGIPVDAIVTIVKLKDMDLIGGTIDNVLSEDYRFEPLTNAEEDKGYVEWQIRFVQDGTVTNAGDEGVPAYLDSFTLEAIDVDGKEFFEAIVTNSYTLEDSSSQPTDLVVSSNGDYTKFQSGSDSVNPIDPADTQYIVRINYENVHVISFRNGSAKENNGGDDRQNSISFSSEVAFNTPDTTVLNSAPTVVDKLGETADVNDTFEIDLLDGANDVDGNLDKKSTQLIDSSDITNQGSYNNPLVVPGVGTYEVDSTGELTFTPLPDYFGPASILFSVSDDLGVGSDRARLGLTVIDPDVPIVSIDSAPLATLANQITYPVTGTCTVGDGNVTVNIVGAIPASQAVACSGGGTWNAGFDVSAIGDGANVISISASQTDAAGNTGIAPPVSASKDATAPVVLTTIATQATLANQMAYPVGGTCSIGDGDVTVSIAGAIPSSQVVTCDGAGNWTAGFNVSTIFDGSNVIDINASQTDAVGNTGNAPLVQADKDTVAPVIVITGAPTATLANQNAYPVSGTCSAGDGNVTVSIPGATPGSQSVACSGGTWSAGFDVSGIADGGNAIAINASQTDAAGNAGNAVLVEADKNTVGLTVAILNAPVMTAGPFGMTIEFSSDVSGFTIGDISVGNGSTAGFVVVDGNTYNVQIIPDGIGDITLDIAANVAQDAASNGNLAASQVVVMLATDADNDGIPDNAECPAGPPFDASCPDTDGDGIPDFQDPDSDNDGIPDDVEIGNDPNNPIDTDGDGVPDYLDQDSDNDGIPDSVEGGIGAIDTDGDGIPDILENGSIGMDTDADGIDDNAFDRDGDGVANYVDLDSDNDGIPDLFESGSSGQDVNGNDIDDAFDFLLVGGIDANMDGIVDTLPDTDSDAVADQFDLDADADGISDLQESGLTALQTATLDTDNNGVIDTAAGSNGLADAIETEDTFFAELDQDGDGLADTPRDTDSDTRADFQDLDSDNDGIHDLVEGSGLDPAAVDGNNDGVVDDNAIAADQDGIPDSVDSDDFQFGGLGNNPADTDGDSIPDFRDLDTDDDGISDLFEAGILDPALVDGDNDGVLDNPLVDNDNDGIPDGGDSLVGYGDPQATGPVDTDGDGLPDIRDLDADNDSIPDVTEGGNQDNDDDGLLDPGGSVTFPPPDTDNDGMPDYVDPDSNNDGTLDVDDAGNGGLDADDDGSVDDTMDADGDGVPDVVDGDPTAFGLKADKDKDDVIDALDLDDDNDGIPDIAEDDGAGNDVDTDGDGLVDRLDHDSDGDGLPDSVEAAQAVRDADADGFVDGFTDANIDGLDDRIDPAFMPVNTDGDADPDFRDLDSDNDSLKDTLEANALDDGLDVNDDGVLDAAADADLDGLAEVVDPDITGGIAGTALPNPDTDGDGLSNYRDADSDNDGINDALELVDSNGDGIPDGLQQGDELETAVRGVGSFGPAGFLLLLLPVLVRLGRSGGKLPMAALVVCFGGLYPLSVALSDSDDINYCGRHSPLDSQDENDFNPCFYFGAGWLPSTHVDPEGDSFGWSTSDDSDSGYQVFGGWYFKPKWFAELSYADLGEAGLSNSNPAITGTEKISYKIPAVFVGYYWYEPQARFNLYGKIGVSSIDNDTTTSRVDYEKQNSVGLSGGIGLQWRSASNGLFARLAADFYDEDARSIGLSLGYFIGGSKSSQQAVVELDSDVDGVMDSMDSCPDTAPGVAVDATGCAIVAAPEPVISDTDADGVIDSRDACPDSEKGAEVDAAGCAELVVVIKQINLSLEGVYFDNDSAEITAASEIILDKAVAALKAAPAARVEVQAHTDSNGEEEYNLGLSARRAENVRNYLISHGIAADRLTAKGYGELRPKATNATREGRARNRRVEFQILEAAQSN